MYQISASERSQLLKQGNKARALYRALCALPYAAGLVTLIVAGMWVLQ